MSRVKSFSDLVGHKHLVDFLKRLIDEDSVPKSLILYGEPGIGKTSIARLIAMSMLCEYATNGECCSKCGTCLSIIEGYHENIVELDAAMKSSLDDIKPLLELSQYRPKFNRKRVIIIDECQRLSQQAFSSMFKTLEESPDYNHFIFVTTSVNKIPESVLSRSIKLALRTPKYFELRAFLDKLSRNQLNEDGGRILIEYSGSKPRDLINAYKITRFIDKTDDLLKLLGHPSMRDLNDFGIAIDRNHLPIVRYLVRNFKENIPDQNHLINCLLNFLFRQRNPRFVRLREKSLRKLIMLSNLNFLQDNLILDAWASVLVTRQKDLEFKLLRDLTTSKDLFEQVYRNRDQLIIEVPGYPKILNNERLTRRLNDFLKGKRISKG